MKKEIKKVLIHPPKKGDKQRLLSCFKGL